MSDKNTIVKMHFCEVIVKCHEGAINSVALDKPLHKLSVGGQPGWSVQFDCLPKLILFLSLSDGTVGHGEFYRDHDWSKIKSMANMLLNKRLDEFPLQNIPIARSREYDGFECAIWDAYAKSKGLRVIDLIGGPLRDRIKVSAWSSHRNLSEIGPLAKKYREMGYDTLKLKCDLNDDVEEWCKEIKQHSNDLKIILDPNERWKNSFFAKPILKSLESIGNVLLVEDPIPRWMWHEYLELRRSSSIPLVLHISLPYAQQAQSIHDSINALRHGSVDGFNFNGGIDSFMQLDAVAAAAGVNCWHGSEIDLGILEAMYIHTACAAKSCVWPSDVFGRLLRQSDLLKIPLRIEPPYAYLPEGLGLGVELDLDVIDLYKQEELIIQ